MNDAINVTLVCLLLFHFLFFSVRYCAEPSVHAVQMLDLVIMLAYKNCMRKWGMFDHEFGEKGKAHGVEKAARTYIYINTDTDTLGVH